MNGESERGSEHRENTARERTSWIVRSLPVHSPSLPPAVCDQPVLELGERIRGVLHSPTNNLNRVTAQRLARLVKVHAAPVLKEIFEDNEVSGDRSQLHNGVHEGVLVEVHGDDVGMQLTLVVLPLFVCRIGTLAGVRADLWWARGRSSPVAARVRHAGLVHHAVLGAKGGRKGWWADTGNDKPFGKIHREVKNVPSLFGSPSFFTPR